MSAILTSPPPVVKADRERTDSYLGPAIEKTAERIRRPILSLTGFEPLLCLVDDVDSPTAANDTVIAMTRLECLEGILDLHDHTCFAHSRPGKVVSRSGARYMSF